MINCKIESNQGLNYIDHLEIKNSSLIHTDLAFEYVSDMDVQIDSIKNPISGKIEVPEVDTLIMDSSKIDLEKTEIICPKVHEKLMHSDNNQKPKD